MRTFTPTLDRTAPLRARCERLLSINVCWPAAAVELKLKLKLNDAVWRGGDWLRPGRCAVFYYKQSTFLDAGQTPIKLRRSEASPADMTRLFDYGSYVAMLKDYLDDRGPKPDPHCVLVLGQERPFCRDDSTLLVSVTVATSRALEDLKNAEAAVSHTLSPVARMELPKRGRPVQVQIVKWLSKINVTWRIKATHLAWCFIRV